MEPFSLEQIAILAFGLATFVYGAFVFAGNRRCFSVLAGGGAFLALHPSEVQYRTSARQSGVAVWLWRSSSGASRCGPARRRSASARASRRGWPAR